MMQMQNVDVVIVGGGMVGLGLAAALKHSALKVLVVEGNCRPAAGGGGR
ncbi:NAD-binding protein [Aeromonas veronii]